MKSIFVLFLTTIFYSCQCAPQKDWMQGMNNHMQEMQQHLQETQQRIHQQMQDTQQRVHQQMQDTQQRIHQQMQETQRQLKDSNQQLQQRIQDIQGGTNQILTPTSGNSFYMNSNTGTSTISGIDAHGKRYYHSVEYKTIDSTEHKTITDYNPATDKMEVSHYTRDLSKPNSGYVLVDNRNKA